MLSKPIALLCFAAALAGCRQFPEPKLTDDLQRQGQEIFRHDTFGNEVFWTDTARLHEVIDDEIQPLEALDLGLKVDMGRLNLLKFVLHNPFGISGTRELLKQNAVVGLKAQVENGRITRIGITCALCHSTVDNALLPGIGHRLDGFPNGDLEVGKILAKLPIFTDEQKRTLRSWPKGTYDPRFNFDGKSTPLVLPPAYGLAHVENETYTAEGPISYWNAYVAVTQMHGRGNFSDPRLGITVTNEPDLVTPKLAALRAYQHSIPAPPPPPAFYDRGAARRGKTVFDANCAQCHVGGNSTDNNNGTLHDPAETGMDAAYAARTTAKKYRTTPLRGLWQHAPYFHDGSAKTLDDVVDHYVRVRNLQLSGRAKSDLVEYLKSL
ncbi:MAG TPA: c-type cytochrome [Gemmatimonadaceae bacterium]|nr:c-type cytochrome [Gemmatimonadaceae bacterium]